MSDMYESGMLEIHGKGVVNTSFLSADFEAKVTTQDKSGPKAKAIAQARIELIQGVIAEFATSAAIETDKQKTSFEVKVHRSYTGNKQVFDGYEAVYTCRFKAKNVSEAIRLHDALTSIEGVEAESPVFNPDVSPEIEAAAFEKAYAEASVRFARQCKIIGLPQIYFTLKRWHILQDRERVGKSISYSRTSGDGPIEIKPGQATYTMKVQFIYDYVGTPV